MGKDYIQVVKIYYECKISQGNNKVKLMEVFFHGQISTDIWHKIEKLKFCKVLNKK